ncbi:MAG TPA: trypsin-like peptidase domain-containing protein [Anaerolineae bacterium]|nr:trypsin-like peptidase domain-containing protein [Anaerolineae bacterium]
MKPKYLLVTLVMVLAFTVAACSPTALSSTFGAVPGVKQAQATSVPQAANSVPALGGVSDLQSTLEQLYTQVNPSVVAINIVGKAAVPSVIPFFGNNGQEQPQIPEQALGSGFVWDKEGHIITNNHVIAGADKIQVTFSDGTIVPATLVGADPDSDLAVIKVDRPADQLQPVKVADSTQVKVGQLAVAIGNPFGNENTMTVGFISAIGRSIPADGGTASVSYTIPDVIQTDAPINPGNSGGVLVDDQGQVMGVTAQIDSPVRASVGIGFVIPSSIVQKVVPELIKSGKYEHSWLGISGGTLIPDLATAMNLKSDQRGALVNQVTAGGPAEKAGLRSSTKQTTINGQSVNVGGDVIIAIDNQPVKTFDDLVAYLFSSTDVGQTVTLTILRDGQQQDVKVTLAARPTTEARQQQADQQVPQEQRRSSPAAGQPWLGIQGLSITSDIAGDLELPSEQSGVLVESVRPDSPAAQAGLQGGTKSVTIGGQEVTIGGDVITAIDGKSVRGMDDLLSILQQAAVGQKVTLSIVRDGKQLELTVTLAARPANP